MKNHGQHEARTYVQDDGLNWQKERVHTLLSAGLLNLVGEADTDQAVVRLELLHGLGGVVDKSETSGLAATELGAQTEDRDLVLAGLVETGKLVTELILGDVGAVGVQDVTVRRSKSQPDCIDALSCLISHVKYVCC